MKTKEYVGKYIKLAEYKTLPDSEFVTLTKELFWDMVDELKEVALNRHIASVSGMDALVKEFNNKGNRISELLDEPLQKNWFATLFSDLFKNSIRREAAHG